MPAGKKVEVPPWATIRDGIENEPGGMKPPAEPAHRIAAGPGIALAPADGKSINLRDLHRSVFPAVYPCFFEVWGSPRVRICSFRSRLWALQIALSGSWASRLLAHSPRATCLSVHLCSFGRTFAFHPFAPTPCGADLAVRLRLAPQAPDGNLSSRETRPLPGTLARLCEAQHV